MAKRGYIKVYKTYLFRNKDPIIDKVRTVVQDSGETYTQISKDSGVSTGTMTNWFHGSTKRPQFASINAVLRAIDKELVIKNRRK